MSGKTRRVEVEEGQASLVKAENVAMLRHMLGLSCAYAEAAPTRNHAAVAPGDPQMQRMVDAGLVRLRGRQFELDYFEVTDAGLRLALSDLLRKRPSLSQRRYRRFLSASDAFPGLTFRKFLTDPYFASAVRDP